MLTMDVFNQDAFSAISMTTAIQDMETVPGFLRSRNIFTPNPVRSTNIMVEKRGQTLNLIPVTERGAARTRRSVDRRNIRNFSTVRIAESHRLMADALQNLRAFGSETELEALQTEIARWQLVLGNDLNATEEYHLLGAISGVLLDTDGSVLYDYFDEFDIVQPAEINFDWANKTKVKTFVAENVTRPIVRALGGRATPGMRITALCGDSFYDGLQENAEYRATYLQTEAARTLLQNTAFQSVVAWGVEWVNYRGTDDNTTVAIASNKCKFVVEGVPNVFQIAYSPAEGFDFVNTLGLERYSAVIPDPSARHEWVDIDVAKYHLPICTTPEILLRGTSG